VDDETAATLFKARLQESFGAWSLTRINWALHTVKHAGI
jgi:hypothetical protein